MSYSLIQVHGLLIPILYQLFILRTTYNYVLPFVVINGSGPIFLRPKINRILWFQILYGTSFLYPSYRFGQFRYMWTSLYTLVLPSYTCLSNQLLISSLPLTLLRPLVGRSTSFVTTKGPYLVCRVYDGLSNPLTSPSPGPRPSGVPVDDL